MLIKIDKYTCADFLSQWVADVNVDIISAGCAGSKISITPRTTHNTRIESDEHNGIRCWVLPEFAQKLDGAQIAKAKGKYYLVSASIESRCGCGTSFSFEKKLIVDSEKIKKIKQALLKI